MSKSKKKDIVTFKIDDTLKEFMVDVKNRSEFIRKAILKSCEEQCPLCKGSGQFTKENHEKWYRIKIILDNHLNEDTSDDLPGRKPKLPKNKNAVQE